MKPLKKWFCFLVYLYLRIISRPIKSCNRFPTYTCICVCIYPITGFFCGCFFLQNSAVASTAKNSIAKKKLNIVLKMSDCTQVEPLF